MLAHLKYAYRTNSPRDLINMARIERFALIIKRLQNYSPRTSAAFNIDCKEAV